MAKQKQTPPETVLTVRLSEETGEFAYQGTLVAARGDDAVLRAFEYFTLEDVLVVMREAVTALEDVDMTPSPEINTTSVSDTASTDDAADLTLSMLDGFDDPLH
ncbi:MAG: hypothetical protein AAFV33_15035 [Chloroflexota bacterium]